VSLSRPSTFWFGRLPAWVGGLFVLFVLSPAQAQNDSPWSLGIALGAGHRDNPFVASDDMKLNAILDLAWHGERWFFDNGDIGYTIREASQLSVNALLTFNNERNYYSYLNDGTSGLDIGSLRQIAVDQDLFFPSIAGGDAADIHTLTTEELERAIFVNVDSALPKRKFAVSSGVELLYIDNWGELQAQVLTDVSGRHDGQSVWLSYAYPWVTQTSEFSLTLGVEWKSADLVKYYYGVRPGEDIQGRSVYKGASGTNGVIRFSASHALTARWNLVGVLEREYLSGAIRRSPIIERGSVDTAFIGLHYQFK
jgi:MipA family protein